MMREGFTMLGKQKCRILKEIRQKIADENDIPYVTRECHFQGDCRGTCPRCESELRYLESQLALRASMGKRVAVAALCASMAFGAAGCSPFGGGKDPGGEIETDLSGAMTCFEPDETGEPVIEGLSGEVAWPDGTDEAEGIRKGGDVAAPPEATPEVVQTDLTGAVYIPPSEGNG